MQPKDPAATAKPVYEIDDQELADALATLARVVAYGAPDEHGRKNVPDTQAETDAVYAALRIVGMVAADLRRIADNTERVANLIHSQNVQFAE